MILLDFFGVIVELLSSDDTQMTNIVLTHYHGVTKARNLWLINKQQNLITGTLIKFVWQVNFFTHPSEFPIHLT